MRGSFIVVEEERFVLDRGGKAMGPKRYFVGDAGGGGEGREMVLCGLLPPPF